MLETPFSVSVPAVMLTPAALLNVVATVRLPPVTARRSSPVMDRLLTVSVPERWVIVWTPATLMTTSSAAPGRSGFELQLVTMSQKLVPPVQSTVADCAGPVPATMAAAINPIVDQCNLCA